MDDVEKMVQEAMDFLDQNPPMTDEEFAAEMLKFAIRVETAWQEAIRGTE